MTFQDYFYNSEESKNSSTSYEEQLLLNYEDYMDNNFATPLSSNNHYINELKEEYPGGSGII